MQISSEVRVFWRQYSRALDEWFQEPNGNGFRPGGGRVRTDVYLIEANPELGIKLRGGKQSTEIKGLVSVLNGSVQIGGTDTRIELWSKWASDAVVIDARRTVRLDKRRWLRKFETTEVGISEIELGADENTRDGRPLPNYGCNVEYTEVTPPSGDVWYTFGLESFGRLETVVASLTSVLQLINERLPQIQGASAESYPTWLSSHFLLPSSSQE